MTTNQCANETAELRALLLEAARELYASIGSEQIEGGFGFDIVEDELVDRICAKLGIKPPRLTGWTASKWEPEQKDRE